MVGLVNVRTNLNRWVQTNIRSVDLILYVFLKKIYQFRFFPNQCWPSPSYSPTDHLQYDWFWSVSSIFRSIMLTPNHKFINTHNIKSIGLKTNSNPNFNLWREKKQRNKQKNKVLQNNLCILLWLLDKYFIMVAKWIESCYLNTWKCGWPKRLQPFFFTRAPILGAKIWSLYMTLRRVEKRKKKKKKIPQLKNN